ncbi:MAG: hypothetical protein FWE47_04085 [Oscillospiraceae bacterium]|nr:hypothetical protein [Oscillospiraceae bacterium]
MKRIFSIVIFIAMVFTLVGCGNSNNESITDGWSGLYKSDSNYLIMLYTDDNKNITIRVAEKFKTSQNLTGFSYPIQLNNVSIKDGDTIEYLDEGIGVSKATKTSLNITKSGDKIIVSASGEQAELVLNEETYTREINGPYVKSDSIWSKLDGTYTKYENVNSKDVEDMNFKVSREWEENNGEV